MRTVIRLLPFQNRHSTSSQSPLNVPKHFLSTPILPPMQLPRPRLLRPSCCSFSARAPASTSMAFWPSARVDKVYRTHGPHQWPRPSRPMQLPRPRLLRPLCCSLSARAPASTSMAFWRSARVDKVYRTHGPHQWPQPSRLMQLPRPRLFWLSWRAGQRSPVFTGIFCLRQSRTQV